MTSLYLCLVGIFCLISGHLTLASPAAFATPDSEDRTLKEGPGVERVLLPTGDNNCTKGPFTTNDTVFQGKIPEYNYAYKQQCHIAWTNGSQVEKITVWASDYHVNGIKLWYSNKMPPMLFGKDNCDSPWGAADCNDNKARHDTIEVGKTQITKFMYKTNVKTKQKDAVGGIYIEAGEKVLAVGPQQDDLEEVNVGSGIMLGAFGWTTDVPHSFLNAWGPLFLAEFDDKAVIEDLTFDKSEEEMGNKGIQTELMDTLIIENQNEPGSNISQLWEFSGNKEYQSTTTWSDMMEGMFGGQLTQSLKVSVGVPMVAGMEAELAYQHQWSVKRTTVTAQSEARTLRAGFRVGSTSNSELQAGHKQICRAEIAQGIYEGPYTTTSTVTVEGVQWKMYMKGDHVGMQWGQVKAGCQTVDEFGKPYRLGKNENFLGIPKNARRTTAEESFPQQTQGQAPFPDDTGSMEQIKYWNNNKLPFYGGDGKVDEQA